MTARVLWIGETDLFNENIARGARRREARFIPNSQKVKSHNEMLIMQRPILDFEARNSAL